MSEITVCRGDAKLGFIGPGLMGSRFLRRLHADGWRIRGWNRSWSTTLQLRNDGFTIEDKPATLVRESDVLLSSFGDDNAVRAVYLGQDGVFANVQPQTIILEISTISPELSSAPAASIDHLYHREIVRRCFGWSQRHK